MPRPWRPAHSKMPMKTGARYSRCGADAALQQRGTSGTALLSTTMVPKRSTNQCTPVSKDGIDAPLVSRPVRCAELSQKTPEWFPSCRRTNKKFPLITERSAASFPLGSALSVVIKTSCTSRPLCSVLRTKFSRSREDDSMWLQITKWTGLSDCWHNCLTQLM